MGMQSIAGEMKFIKNPINMGTKSCAMKYKETVIASAMDLTSLENNSPAKTNGKVHSPIEMLIPYPALNMAGTNHSSPLSILPSSSQWYKKAAISEN